MTKEELVIYKKLRFTALELIFIHKYTLDSSWQDDQIPMWNVLVYILHGRVSLTIHNTTTIVNEGNIIALTKSQWHNMRIFNGETAEVYICCFVADCDYDIYKDKQSAFKFINIPNIIPVDDTIEAEKHFSQLLNVSEIKEAKDIFKRVEKTAELIYWVISQCSAKIILSEDEGFDFLDTITFIDRYYCEKIITIDMLAKRLHISPAHFMREFKKKYGISCSKYIQTKRINRALDMLCNSKSEIGEVAQACMFDSQAYMAKLIKRATGMSPTEYREYHKNNIEQQ